MIPIPTTTSMRFFTVDARDLAAHPDAIASMMAREYTGFIIKGALSVEQCQAGITRLAGEAPPVPRLSNAHFAGWSHGPGIVNAGEEVDAYLAGAVGLREGFAAAFGFDVVERCRQLFSTLGGGRSIDTPRSADGRLYSPVTARALAATGSLPIHCGNETHTWPSMSHIASFIDPTDQLSFFTTLAVPERGGELIVYDVQHSVPGDPVMQTLDGFNVSPEIEARGSLSLRPDAGDMILFDGGRYYHRVVPIEGEQHRWTLGGFMALDAEKPHVWFWS